MLRSIGVVGVALMGIAFAADLWFRFGLADSNPYWAAALPRSARAVAGAALCLVAAHGFSNGGERGRRIVRSVVLTAALFWFDGVVLAFNPDVATRFGFVRTVTAFVVLGYCYFSLDRPSVRAAFAAAAQPSANAPMPTYALVLTVIAGVALGTMGHEVAWRRLGTAQAEVREREGSDRSARIARKEPVVRLPFDGSIVDTGPQDFPVTVAGAPPRFDAGVAGQAIMLDGRTNWIDLDPYVRVGVGAARVSLESGATVEMWFAPNELQADREPQETLIVISGGGNNVGIELSVENGRRTMEGHILGAASIQRSGDLVQVTDSAPIPALRWTHAALVYDGTEGTLELFANGKSTGRVTGAPTRRTWFPISFRVGAYADHQLFAGRIDDVRLYEYPRSPADIAEDANAATH